MDIQTYKIKQYNSTYKHVLVIDGKPVLCTASQNRLALCIAYITDKSVEIRDGKIRKILDSISTSK